MAVDIVTSATPPAERGRANRPLSNRMVCGAPSRAGRSPLRDRFPHASPIAATLERRSPWICIFAANPRACDGGRDRD